MRVDEVKTRWSSTGVVARADVALFGCLVLLVIVAAGCFSSSAPVGGGRVCRSGRPVTLLTTTLQRLKPSDVFYVPAGRTIWMSTTARRDGEGLFGDVGSVAVVSLFTDGTSPRITTDAQDFLRSADITVSLDRSNEWVRVPVGAGRWRIYTTGLGVTALPVAIVACIG